MRAELFEVGATLRRLLPAIVGAAVDAFIRFALEMGTRGFDARSRADLTPEVGLLGAAFATVSPSLTEFGVTVRPYSLMPLLAVVSTYANIANRK